MGEATDFGGLRITWVNLDRRVMMITVVKLRR